MARRNTARKFVRTAGRAHQTLHANARTALRTAEMMLAAGRVLGARGEIGLRALTAPAEAGAELTRLVPEKIQAFASAGAAVAKHSAEIAQELSTAAVDEVTRTGQAAASLALCGSPAAFFALQSSLAMSWMTRGAAQSAAMAALFGRLQAAALSPVHRAATQNARRLAKR